MFRRLWAWYERHYLLNLSIATFLFLFQIFHLYWLFTDVILFKLIGRSYFFLPQASGIISIFIDYSEVPAIISTTILYFYLIRRKFSYKHLWFIFTLNIQWLHLFWITDEVVIERFAQEFELFHWSNAIAWVAILIDYLELPVIFDTSKKLYQEIKARVTPIP